MCLSVHVYPSVCISAIYLYVSLLYSGIHLEIAEVCTFKCSWSVSALILCNSIGDNSHSGRGTPKSWYEDNREHLQQFPEAGEKSEAGLPSWSLFRAKRLHLLQPARFNPRVSSHTSTKSCAPRLFQSHHSQPANGTFPGSYQQSTHQHNVMPSDSDSDSSSIAHSEEEVHLHSNFNEMEMGTVDQCGRVHRTIQSTMKDVSLFVSVFLNCIFMTIILFLLAYHNHLPMYSFSWYS